jgi:hypothetical protein
LLKEFRIRFFYSSAGAYEIFAVLDTEKMEEITSDHYPMLCPKLPLEKKGPVQDLRKCSNSLMRKG